MRRMAGSSQSVATRGRRGSGCWAKASIGTPGLRRVRDPSPPRRGGRSRAPHPGGARETGSPSLPELARRPDEAGEEGMGGPGPRPELRVELPGDEPRVIGQLDDLHETFLRPHPRDPEAVLLEERPVLVGDLVAMAVALLDLPRAVDLRGQRVLGEDDGIEPESHRAAE